jgi:hypothetical protein
MPGIRKKRIRVIEDNEEEVSRYCFHCKEFGFYNKLGPKIISRGEKPAPDHDKWCQCYFCGKIYARHETTPEEKITSIIETIDNPFDNEQYVTGLDNKVKDNSREKERQKILDMIEDEKDQDIKEALRRGNTVEIIE